MRLLSSPSRFGALCPKVRERTCNFISPHIPAGRGLPCKQLHPRQIAHEGNNLFPGLVRLFAVGLYGRNNKLMDIRCLPFGVPSCGQQANFCVSPCPKSQPIKPAIRFFVLFQPDKSHTFISKAPRFNEMQSLGELGERSPQKKCTVPGGQICHRERT